VTFMKMDDALTIGQRVLALRTAQNFTQDTLAEGICSHQTISVLERGQHIPKPHIMTKLAKRLKVPLHELMGMQEEQVKIDAQITYVRIYIETGEFGRSLGLAEELLARDDLLEYQRNELLIHQAESLMRSGRCQEGIDILRPFLEGQDVQQKLEDERLCDAYNKLGYGYFELYEFEKAYAAYHRGYIISLRLPSFDLVAARITKNLGLACNQLDMKREARLYLEQARRFYSSIADMKGIANVYFELAIASGDASYATKALTLYESMDLLRESCVVQQHCAYHFDAQQDYGQALHKLSTTAKEFEKMGDIGMALFTLSRAVMVCVDHEDRAQAEKYLHLATAQQEHLSSHDTYMLAYYFRAISRYHLLHQNYDDCVLNSQISAEMCARMEMYAECAESMQIEANAYHEMNLHEKAYLVLQQAYEYLAKTRRRSRQ